VTLLHGPVWIVALGGAVLSAAILPREGRIKRVESAIAWDILASSPRCRSWAWGSRMPASSARLSDAYAHARGDRQRLGARFGDREQPPDEA
jgi:hypothetical protein